MLRSRSICQICHTYSEDMHPIYPPLYTYANRMCALHVKYLQYIACIQIKVRTILMQITEYISLK